MKKFYKIGIIIFALIIGTTAFAADWGYDLTADETGIVIKDYLGQAKDVVIPSTIEGYPVKEIGYRAFACKMFINSIRIPNSVTIINNEAFAICKALQNVKFSDSLVTIGNEAFAGCESLKSIEIPDSVTKIGEKAFGDYNYNILYYSGYSYCENLSYVKFPKGPVTIGNKAFCKTALTSLTITGNMKFEGYEQFYDCNKLTTVVIEADVVSLPNADYDYFIDSENLSNLIFKSPDTVIGKKTIRMYNHMTLKMRKEIESHIDLDKKKAEEERILAEKKAEEERAKAEAERIKAEAERIKAEAERIKAETERAEKIVKITDDIAAYVQEKGDIEKNALYNYFRNIETDDDLLNDAFENAVIHKRIVDGKPLEKSDYYFTPEKAAEIQKEIRVKELNRAEEKIFNFIYNNSRNTREGILSYSSFYLGFDNQVSEKAFNNLETSGKITADKKGRYSVNKNATTKNLIKSSGKSEIYKLNEPWYGSAFGAMTEPKKNRRY